MQPKLYTHWKRLSRTSGSFFSMRCSCPNGVVPFSVPFHTKWNDNNKKRVQTWNAYFNNISFGCCCCQANLSPYIFGFGSPVISKNHVLLTHESMGVESFMHLIIFSLVRLCSNMHKIGRLSHAQISMNIQFPLADNFLYLLMPFLALPVPTEKWLSKLAFFHSFSLSRASIWLLLLVCRQITVERRTNKDER